MMFFTLNIMENIRYFNTKISHFNYIFKIIQYILYYCRILCRWWASAGAGVIVVIIAVVVSGHLQLQVVLPLSCGTCSCKCCHHRPWVPAGVWWPSSLVVEVVVVVVVVVMVVTVVDRGGW